MKTTYYAYALALLLASPLAGAQTPVPAQPDDPRPTGPEDTRPPVRSRPNAAQPVRRAPAALEVPNPPPPPSAPLRKFDLNFPGGQPADLIRAIENAMQKPLNAIVPNDYADTQLPPLRLKDVTVPQLFSALQMASEKKVAYVTGHAGFGGGPRSASYSFVDTSFGFRTQGTPSDDSIWYFFREDPPVLPSEAAPAPLAPPKVCRFYQMAPFLVGRTVEDITTAVETGWKMLGETDTPALSFHKETQLLIAVGDPSKLELIDQVLAQLKPGTKTENQLPGVTPLATRPLRKPADGQ
jgi:hypothetical protein